MRQIFIFIIGFIALTLLFNSCNEPFPKEIELEKFMYLSLSGSQENPVIKNVDLDENTTFSFFASYGGTTNYNKGEVVIEITIDNSLVTIYNSKNNTSYKILPEKAISLDKGTLTIKNGERVSDQISITINPQLIDFKYEYILPVTIQSVSEGKIPINEEFKTIYYVIEANLDNYNWEKETWEIIDFSSEWNDSQFSIKNIFDGKKETSWHSHPFDPTLNGMPQWFIVDMKKRRPAIRGFKIWNRQDDHSMEPKHVTFSVSEDNNNWTQVLELMEMSNDFKNELDYKTTTPTRGRYLKVEIKSNWGNGNWTYLGEITPY